MKVEELYDVLDEDYRVIGQASWSIVHKYGLLHQGVHGILFKNKLRKETLIKRRNKSMVQDSGHLEISVAGHTISGQSPEDAIKNELQEELLGGIIPKSCSVSKIGTYLNNDIPNNNELIHLYEIIYPGPFTTDEESEGQPEWLNFKDLLREMRNHPKHFAQYSINATYEYAKLMKLN